MNTSPSLSTSPAGVQGFPRTARELAITCAVTAALVVVASVLSFARSLHPLARASLWGLVCLASFAGWGAVFDRVVVRARAGWGLRMAWGMGVVVALGGLLCLFMAARRPVLFALVLVGLAALAVSTVPQDQRPRPWATLRAWPAGALVVLAGLLPVVVLHYLAGAAGIYLQGNDDFVIYLGFPEKILATGSLIEPYSMRRMAAYGGHSLLQAFTLLGSQNPLQVPLLDVSLCLIVVCAMLLEATPSDARVPKYLVLLPLAFLVFLPNTRINSGSEMSGVLFFLGLFLTASLPAVDLRAWRGAAAVGLMAAAACTLRQSNIIPAALFVAGFALFRSDGGDRRARLTALLRAALTSTAFVLPWALLSYVSNRTFLFPIAPGNYNPAYGQLTAASDLETRLKFFWVNINHNNPIRTTHFFLFGGALIPALRSRGALPVFLAAAFAGFMAMVWSFPLSDPWNISRYYFGFCVAAVLAVSLVGLQSPWIASAAERPRTYFAAALVLAALVLHIQEVRGTIFEDGNRDIDTFRAAASAKASSLASRARPYRELQSTVPAGAPLLVMLHEPFWLDYRRNNIQNLDLPGSVSPAPGMPLDNDEETAAYMMKQGFRYLAFARSEQSHDLLYDRGHWAAMAKDGFPIWKIAAPFYLKMFDRMDGLMKTRKRLYDAGGMVVLDLATRQ